MMQKTFTYIRNHKVKSALLLMLLSGGGWYAYSSHVASASLVTRYVLSTTKKGTLVMSVSGSGQVASTQQVDVKPKMAGTITSVRVLKGQKVKAGALIATLDSRDAQKALRDATTALETAKLDLDDLLSPPDELTVLQTEHALEQAKETKASAEDGIAKAHTDGFNAVASAFLDFPDVVTGVQDILYGNQLSSGQSNVDYLGDQISAYERFSTYAADAVAANTAARRAYDANFASYRRSARTDSGESVEALVDQTYRTAETVSEAVKTASNLLQTYKDKLTSQGKTPLPLVTTQLAKLAGYTATVNSQMTSLLSVIRSVEDSRQAIVSADRTISERTAALEKMRAGATALDIRAKKLAVAARQDDLADARENLADYSVLAPFDGLVAEMDTKKGDSASTSTIIATLLSEQMLAEISLSEVDAAKVKVGQQATLTFDAVAGLTLTGTVADVDSVGTVSQGVVTYKVKISFDAQDDRIKPSMTVAASIIVDTKPDVILVPLSAVKKEAGSAYVQVPVAGSTVENAAMRGVELKVPPERRAVEIGASNDESYEITGGLDEGETVVTSVISAASAAAAPATAANRAQGGSNSAFGVPGAGAVLRR